MQVENDARIVVAVRKRPLNRKELSRGDIDIVDVHHSQVIVKETRTKVDLTKYVEEHQFNFDAAFDESVDNEQLYISVVRPIVEAAFNKAKVTCFAYGQTGSGKTYTMLGDGAGVAGMYLLAAYDIFTLLNNEYYQNLSLSVSFYEIYCGKLYDLLNERSILAAREDAKGNVQIVNLQERKINTVEQLMKVIEQGSASRVTASNSSNNDSSRSHAILQINLKDGNKSHGKLAFIDLAGSERGADVLDTNKQTRFDGAEINKSLLALKECIRALDQGKNHTPFRGSKLTLVLKDSFVGNCRTVMIGNFSPSSLSAEHTLNTLRYADRVKEIKKTGERSNNRDLQGQINSLDIMQRELMLPRQGNRVPVPTPQPNQVNQVLQVNNVPKQSVQFNQFKQQSNPLQNYQNQNLFPVQSTQQNQQFINLQNQMPGYNLQNNNSNPLLFQQQQIQPQQFQQQSPYQQPPQQFQQQTPYQNHFRQSLPNPTPIQTKQSIAPQQRTPNRHEDDLVKIGERHEQLISQILEAEEELILMHRNSIDSTVEIVKQEMMLLHNIDKPGSDVDEYVRGLEQVLILKGEENNMLLAKLNQFKKSLQEEEQLQKQFYDQKSSLEEFRK
ncbi:hypothetical protein pb186bvf_004781 [Paramecium bursaria]